MYNLLISLAVGVVVTAAVRLGFGSWVAAVVPGLITAVAAYIVLARRSQKQLEALFEGMQREVQAQRPEKAIALLKGGFALAPWQFLVASQLHSQIGVLLYVQKSFDEAAPHLEKSFSRHWLAQAMRAVSRFRRNDLAGMEQVFEEATKVSKKEGLLWAAWAWCLEKAGRHADAVKVIGRGVAANPSDEKLKSAQQSLANGKRLKLGKTYGQEWFALHLEAPPTVMGPPPRGFRRQMYQRH
ncbi:tetratricopeptide repeat protein [Anaeromyxobacter paludicola]|uniref:Tetratricopeptide repeat protein n=1 Tax=Anaeromyxobacter paludicola TaxID=2918171 RepID=A0ABN6N3P9_9BACT|nr:hypothetical protein [Anaeromyxobacter paludicola]BDG07793.1 hypothetical protein AMPC_09060 [Anaeromyxobacter paludicola]